MRDVMRRIRLIGEMIGCTVAISHHVPKQNKETAGRRPGQNLRGSSAIHGSIDSGLYIQPGDSDGSNTFAAGVVSQVKNARSAGAFGLELSIDDDTNGEAVRVTWTHSSEAPAETQNKTPTQSRRVDKERADDDKLFEFIRAKALGGELFGLRQLRMLASSGNTSQYRVRNSIERLLKQKRVFIADEQVRVPGVE